ncbi:hemerythrin domain-containing protein [Nonomuraea sp. LPB2021202275-12-8]|uniref:hemerythrin domain-containing protein n=1 Tax=Nonomuraea sp. LPB2021202275-12-8 TaxID=3120159 RepID=UPI00300C31B1
MSNLDMTAMYAMHDALRRELTHMARVTAKTGDEPRRILRTAAGWHMFKKSLRIHHTAEDDALWPALRQSLADQQDDLVLLEVMEAEHAAIEPLMGAIDAALTDPDADRDRLGDLTDALATSLAAHLKHEEDAAIPLIQRTATVQQWAHFGQVHGQRIGPDAPRLIPWLLEGTDEQTVATMLAPLPEPVRAAYVAQWQPAYACLDHWSAES